MEFGERITGWLLDSPIQYIPGINYAAFFVNMVWRGVGGGLTTNIDGIRMHAFVSPREVLYAPADAGEPKVMAIWRELIDDNDYVVDLGSGIGVYAIHAAQEVNSEGAVWAVEPDREKLSTLAYTIDDNNLDIICAPFAAHEEYGSVSWQGVSLSTRPLNDIIPRADVIKMDIEGFEDRAIRGLWSRLEDDSPVIVLEWHPNEVGNTDRVRQDLTQLGYDTYRISDNGVFPEELGSEHAHYLCATDSSIISGLEEIEKEF